MKRLLFFILLSFVWFNYAAAQNDDIEVTDSTSTDWGDDNGGNLNPQTPSGPVTSMTISQTSVTLEGGQCVRLVATVNANAANKAVTWTSSNSEIATVDAKGNVLGLKKGNTTITATAVGNSSVKKTCTVKVTSDFEGPDKPCEPTSNTFYLTNKMTKPGAMVKFPIYLSNVRLLKDMTFQLEFPEVMTPDFYSVEISAKAIGYRVSYTKVDEKNYIFTLTGGEVPAGNAALMVFTIHVANDIATAQDYPVKINLVEVTEEDETVTTASTRNGRISVYKNGDTNGDDVVNVVDVANTISSILGETPDGYIVEAADTNDDEDINVVDVAGTIDIILGNEGSSEPEGTDPD